ncbi:hypothetical protein, partial [Heyndrickxia sporothermodurans]
SNISYKGSHINMKKILYSIILTTLMVISSNHNITGSLIPTQNVSILNSGEKDTGNHSRV